MVRCWSSDSAAPVGFAGLKCPELINELWPAGPPCQCKPLVILQDILLKPFQCQLLQIADHEEYFHGVHHILLQVCKS